VECQWWEDFTSRACTLRGGTSGSATSMGPRTGSRSSAAVVLEVYQVWPLARLTLPKRLGRETVGVAS